MKTILILLSAALVSSSGRANPLVREQVAGDAKWLLHLDFTQFRKTQIGGYFFSEVIEKEMPKAEAGLKAAMGIDLPWRAIESLTAYGTDFKAEAGEKGVLIVTTSTNIAKLFDQAAKTIAALAKDPTAPLPFKRDLTQSMPVYRIQDELVLALPADNLLVMGKKMSMINSACAVIAGKLPNMKTAKAFSDFPDAPAGFCVLAAAEGFNQSADLPPQARVLQMADGARIVLGEQDENLFVNLLLKTKTLESAQQMQQVFQGLMALALIGQTGDPNLLELIQNLKVAGAGKTVSVGLNYPVAKALKQIQDAHLNLKLHPDADAPAADAHDDGDRPLKKNKAKKAKKAAEAGVEGNNDGKAEKPDVVKPEPNK